MSTDTSFADLEARLRDELPRLADELVALDADPVAADEVRVLDLADGGARRRWLVPIAAVAAAVLVLLGVVVAVRVADRHDVGPVDVGPAPVEAGWTPMAPSPLSPREAAASVWTGTEVIIWGGRVGDTALLDGAAYNPSTDTWRPIAPNSWGHPAAHAVWTGTEMVVLAKNGGAAYDPATDTWRDLPRQDGGGGFIAPVWTGDHLLGVSLDIGAADAVGVSVSTLQAAGGQWLQGPSIDVGGSAFAGTSDYQVVWTGNEAIVWDGARHGWAYNPSRGSWRALPELATPDGRVTVQSIPVAWQGSMLVLSQSLGGPDGVGIGLERWTERWDDLGGLDAHAIDAHAAAVSASDQVLVLPVEGRPVAVHPIDGTWTPLDDAPIPDGADRANVWTGDDVVVWGGIDAPSGQPTANGWRWRP